MTEAKEKTVGIDNPWTGSNVTRMTWAEIAAFGHENVHPNDLKSWLKEARIAFKDEDGAQLGIMIIGS